MTPRSTISVQHDESLHSLAIQRGHLANVADITTASTWNGVNPFREYAIRDEDTNEIKEPLRFAPVFRKRLRHISDGYTVQVCELLIYNFGGAVLTVGETDKIGYALSGEGRWIEDRTLTGPLGWMVYKCQLQLLDHELRMADRMERAEKHMAKAYNRFEQNARGPGRQAVIETLPLALHLMGDMMPDVSYHTHYMPSADHLNLHGFVAFKNGVVDMTSGQLLPPHEAAYAFATHYIPHDFNPNESQRRRDQEWLLAQMPSSMQSGRGREQVVYLKHEIGFSLHGRPSRRFVALIGPTAGGKTTLLQLAGAALGPGYLTYVSQDVFSTRKTNGGLRPELIALMTCRIAIIEEAERILIDKGILKAVSGDSGMAFRDLYKGEKTGTPTGTVFFSNNEAPRFNLSDRAVLDRMRPIYLPSIPEDERDPAFLLKMQDQHHRVCNALFQYALDNQTPPQMPSYNVQMRQEMLDDEVGEAGLWLHECLAQERGQTVTTDEIWTAFRQHYGADEKAKTVEGYSRRRLLSAVKQHYQLGRLVKINGKRGWENWTLKSP